SNSRQCGQVSDPYSISLSLALGLPMRKPPAGVALTTVDQSPPLGGGTGLASTGALVAASPCLELQPATATRATAQARNGVGFMGFTCSVQPRGFALRRLATAKAARW